MLVTISDRKNGVDSTSDGNIDYYTSDILNANDYYPFGMLMPERKYSVSDVYRYGFNGKENDNEVKGESNQQDYGMRFYDPRLGRFLSVDPLQDEYPELTSYQFASNDPIRNIDLDGLEGSDYSGKITNATPGQRLNHPVWSFFRDLSADVLNLTPIGAGDELVNNWNKSNTTEKVQLSLNFLTSDFTPFGGPSLPSGKLHIEPTSPKTPLKGTVKPANEQPTQGTAVTNTNKQVTQANSKNTEASNANSASFGISSQVSSKLGETKKTQAGGTIINSKWSDQFNPSASAAGYQVPVKANGYPDFNEYLYLKAPEIPDGNKVRPYNTVQIKMTGSYKADFEAANKVAGLSKTPEGYTWHHTEKMGTMQLIETRVHQSARHSGGVQLYKEQHQGKGY